MLNEEYTDKSFIHLAVLSTRIESGVVDKLVNMFRLLDLWSGIRGESEAEVQRYACCVIFTCHDSSFPDALSIACVISGIAMNRPGSCKSFATSLWGHLCNGITINIKIENYMD